MMEHGVSMAAIQQSHIHANWNVRLFEYQPVLGLPIGQVV